MPVFHEKRVPGIHHGLADDFVDDTNIHYMNAINRRSSNGDAENVRYAEEGARAEHLGNLANGVTTSTTQNSCGVESGQTEERSSHRKEKCRRGTTSSSRRRKRSTRRKTSVVAKNTLKPNPATSSFSDKCARIRIIVWKVLFKKSFAERAVVKAKATWRSAQTFLEKATGLCPYVGSTTALINLIVPKYLVRPWGSYFPGDYRVLNVLKVLKVAVVVGIAVVLCTTDFFRLNGLLSPPTMTQPSPPDEMAIELLLQEITKDYFGVIRLVRQSAESRGRNPYHHQTNLFEQEVKTFADAFWASCADFEKRAVVNTRNIPSVDLIKPGLSSFSGPASAASNWIDRYFTVKVWSNDASALLNVFVKQDVLSSANNVEISFASLISSLSKRFQWSIFLSEAQGDEDASTTTAGLNATTNAPFFGNFLATFPGQIAETMGTVTECVGYLFVGVYGTVAAIFSETIPLAMLSNFRDHLERKVVAKAPDLNFVVTPPTGSAGAASSHVSEYTKTDTRDAMKTNWNPLLTTTPVVTYPLSLFVDTPTQKATVVPNSQYSIAVFHQGNITQSVGVSHGI